MATPTDTTTVLDPTAPAPSAPPSASSSAPPSAPAPSSSGQQPSIGRVVHYLHPFTTYTAEGSPDETRSRVHGARIARVNDDGTCNLAIDDDVGDVGDVVKGAAFGTEPGCWFWPPRV